jgi:hypothetical protein
VPVDGRSYVDRVDETQIRCGPGQRRIAGASLSSSSRTTVKLSGKPLGSRVALANEEALQPTPGAAPPDAAGCNDPDRTKATHPSFSTRVRIEDRALDEKSGENFRLT